MTINYDQALEALKELAAERPDYVYSAAGTGHCVYGRDENTPSCIVGHVIYKLAPEEFPRVVAVYNHDGVGSLVGGYASNPIFEDEDRLKLYMLLATAQDHQDNGDAWGRAVEIAIETAEDFNV